MITNTKRWFRNSITIFWARLLSFLGFLLEAISQVADLLDMPAIKQQLQAVVPAKYWPIYLIVIGLTTELARRRTLKGGE